jgi:transposase
MIALHSGVRYFLRRSWTDLRNGFDGLSGIVRNEFQRSPLKADVFIFYNRRRTQIKLLKWEGDGFAVYFKRLERGTFELPEQEGNAKEIELSNDAVHLILRGISLKSIKQRKRYRIVENME